MKFKYWPTVDGKPIGKARIFEVDDSTVDEYRTDSGDWKRYGDGTPQIRDALFDWINDGCYEQIGFKIDYPK